MRYNVRLKEHLDTTVIIALYNIQGKILILQRGSTAPWEPNKWSLVGGVVDPHEKDIDALTREVKEETHLMPYDIKYKGAKKESWGILKFYTGKAKGNVTLDWENQDYAWISKSEINNYKFVPSVKEYLLSL